MDLPAARPPLRVLVVDDEALVRWSVAETLTDGGCHVHQAFDGASARALVADAAHPFDVVVLDLRLPDVSDLSLVAHVRRDSPTSAVVVMTAFGTPETVSAIFALGVSHVVPKPFELPALQAIVFAAGGSPRATTP